jgi:hypothetical protein
VDVVILAGGRCPSDLAEATGVENRAELMFDGKTFAEIVLAATSPLGDPVMVGGPPGLARRQVPGGRTFVESVRNGLDAVVTDRLILATVDLPFLTEASVRDLVARSDESAALNYPVIPSAKCEEAFPGMRRTTLRLREGSFTGGNLAVMRTDLMKSALPILESAYEARKSPLRLARMVGWGTLFRVVLARAVPQTLGLRDLERSVGRLLQVTVRAVQTDFAEVGADIDNLAQYNRLTDLKKTA